MYTKCQKMPFTWLKTLLKIERFVHSDTRDKILLIKIMRLTFSNAHSEAGMKDIDTIQIFSGVLLLDTKSQGSS